MASRSERSFESIPAVRSRVPLWVGLVGPSGSGKTFSALRLATGMSKVYGDGIFVIDTEARRSTYYAEHFKFTIVDFKAPFGPLDYAGAIRHCLERGAKTIVIDSMSHEWEGQGGVLEQHDAECDRLAGQWKTTRDKVQMSAWQVPKGDHRRLLSDMLQSGANFITCYRAREKLKVIPGKQPVPLGWMPVASDDFVYEATLNCLLYPGSGGVPAWSPGEQGEKAIVKLPQQFAALFKERRPLDEDAGEALAKWAAGGASSPPITHALASAGPGTKAASSADLEALRDQLIANGMGTPTQRLGWVSVRLERQITNPTQMTSDEVAICLKTAEEEAA